VGAPLRIVVTGASGFVGRLLVTLLRRHNHVVAVDRRVLSASEMADHPNVEWYQVDLCDREAVEGTMDCIAAGGGAQVLPMNRAEASHEPQPGPSVTPDQN
jgi:nucleoside-diphosphate-sugar epimerase